MTTKWRRSSISSRSSGRCATRESAFDHIDYGATALRREVVAALPEVEPHDLSLVQRDLAREGKLRAYAAERRFFEIGSPAGLADLEAELSSLPLGATPS